MILTLPMAGLIRKYYPESRIFFLGRTYTRDIVSLSEHVDEFINYDEIEKLGHSAQVDYLRRYEADVFIHVFPRKKIALLAKEAGIPLRVGTTNRVFHWMTCSRLIKLSRKRSPLHEAQLNFRLLSFLNIPVEVEPGDIPSYYGFTNVPFLEEQYNSLIDKERYNLILHPRSKGSAKEWGLDNYEKLIALLPPGQYKLFISGTAEDGVAMSEFIARHPEVTDMTGRLTLQQFIAFIHNCDGLVAASTGPLHIAAALNKKAIGLFSPRRPIHPGRWRPLGQNAHVLVFDEACEACSKKQPCECITRIGPERILALLKDKT